MQIILGLFSSSISNIRFVVLLPSKYTPFLYCIIPNRKSVFALAGGPMTLYRNDKGIIHTTSYKQLVFIKENISQENKCRLLETNPEIQRDEVIAEHANTTEPTVLISPSLYIGLDLKDDLSRFQIITKIPYPDLGDGKKYISSKLNRKLRCDKRHKPVAY
jgi:hypothetical protein